MTDDLELRDEDFEGTEPDAAMAILEQLQKYQFVIRKIIPLCDAYEAAVLIQIVDRTTGWKKHKAAFTPKSLYGGDRLYGGISRSMHRSRFHKALASLEARGIISRAELEYPSSQRVFCINYAVDLEALAQTAKPKSHSATR